MQLVLWAHCSHQIDLEQIDLNIHLPLLLSRRVLSIAVGAAPCCGRLGRRGRLGCTALGRLCNARLHSNVPSPVRHYRPNRVDLYFCGRLWLVSKCTMSWLNVLAQCLATVSCRAFIILASIQLSRAH